MRESDGPTRHADCGGSPDTPDSPGLAEVHTHPPEGIDPRIGVARPLAVSGGREVAAGEPELHRKASPAAPRIVGRSERRVAHESESEQPVS